MDILSSITLDTSKIKGRKTKLFRDIAKKYKKQINELDISSIYKICEQLLDTRRRGETLIAYQIIFDVKNKYNEDTFTVFEKWLHLYVKDWWDCDDFMTHAFQYVLMKYPKNLTKIKNWIKSDNFAVRRSASVILIRPAQKGLLEKDLLFKICDLSMNDPHYLVQKGSGWLLKEAYKAYPIGVTSYLERNVSKMTRTAFRYALEKFPKDEKERLMSIKI